MKSATVQDLTEKEVMMPMMVMQTVMGWEVNQLMLQVIILTTKINMKTNSPLTILRSY